MERTSKRLLINLLLGFTFCSLLLRAILLASGLEFFSIVVDLVGFALFWAVIATFIHLLLIESKHRRLNSLVWTVLLIVYLPVAWFVNMIGSHFEQYQMENYPKDIVVERHFTMDAMPYATYSEATFYLWGFIYRKEGDEIDLTIDDLEVAFPAKYELVPKNLNYFVWESKKLLFNFNDRKVYPAVRKVPDSRSNDLR